MVFLQKRCLLALGMVIISVKGFAESNPLEKQQQSNLKKALYCMEILENRPDMAPDERISILRESCFAEHYIQHSPYVEDGREAVLELFAKRFKERPGLTTSIKRSAAQGDMVWLHQHVQNHPDDLGRAVVNIFRMEQGKFVEHWNVVQKVPETAKNNNTMF